MFVRKQMRLFVAFALFVLTAYVVFAVLVYLTNETIREADDWVAHTNRVQTAIDEFHTAFVNADVSAREAIMYDTNGIERQFSDVQEKLDYIERLLSDNAAQLTNVQKTRAALKARQDLLVQFMSDRKTAPYEDVARRMAEMRSTNTARLVLNDIAALHLEESKLFETRWTEAQKYRMRLRSAVLLMMFATGAAFLFNSIFAFYTLWTKQQAGKNLRELAAHHTESGNNRGDVTLSPDELEQKIYAFLER